MVRKHEERKAFLSSWRVRPSALICIKKINLARSPLAKPIKHLAALLNVVEEDQIAGLRVVFLPVWEFANILCANNLNS